MPESTRRASEPDVRRRRTLVSFADGYPFLVTNEASLADLNARLAQGIRAADEPLPAQPRACRARRRSPRTAGASSASASAVLRMAKPCGRCQVTTTDQATGEVMGPEPLSVLTAYRDSAEFGARFGMNAVPVSAGARARRRCRSSPSLRAARGRA